MTGGRRAIPGRHWVLGAALAVAVRPWLWGIALATAARLARPGWWRHWPPVPPPPEGYWHFRLETAYGVDAPPEPADVVSYLQWCRSMPPTRG